MAADDTASVAKTALMAAAGVMRKSVEVLLSQVCIFLKPYWLCVYCHPWHHTRCNVTFAQGSLSVPTPNLPSLWSALASLLGMAEVIVTGNGTQKPHSSPGL